MPTNDQGFEYPANTGVAPSGASQLLALADSVLPRSVQLYASAANRASRRPSPGVGELSVRSDAPTHVEVWDGTRWVDTRTRAWEKSWNLGTGVRVSPAATYTSPQPLTFTASHPGLVVQVRQLVRVRFDGAAFQELATAPALTGLSGAFAPGMGTLRTASSSTEWRGMISCEGAFTTQGSEGSVTLASVAPRFANGGGSPDAVVESVHVSVTVLPPGAGSIAATGTL